VILFAFGFQKRVRRSSPGRAQNYKNGKGKRPIRREEDEDEEPESESASESDAETRPREARGTNMDDAEFERRNMDRIKAAIERKSANKGVSPYPRLVFIALHFC